MIEGLSREAIEGWLKLRDVLRRIRRNKSIVATHADLYEELLARALQIGDLRIAATIDDLKKEIGVKDHRTIKTGMAALQERHDLVRVVDFSVDYGTYLIEVYPPRPGPGEPPNDPQKMLQFGELDPPCKKCAKNAQSLQACKQCANYAQRMQASKSGGDTDLGQPPASNAQSMQAPPSMDTIEEKISNLPLSHRTTRFHGSMDHGKTPHGDEPPAIAARGGGEQQISVGLAEALGAYTDAAMPQQQKNQLEDRILREVGAKLNRAIAGKAADMVVYHGVELHHVDRALIDLREMRKAGTLRSATGFIYGKFSHIAHRHLDKELADRLFPDRRKPETAGETQ